MAYFLFLISVLIFASALVGIRAALVDYEPLELAAFRFIIASLTVTIYSLFIRIRLPARKDIILFLLVSFLFYTRISDEMLRELQCEIKGLSHGTVTLEAGFAVSECRLLAGYA